MKIHGIGVKFGRKIGIEVFGNYFYVDLVRLFHDDQKGQKDIVKSVAYTIFPSFHVWQQVYKLGRNLSKDGREIYAYILNCTKYHWKKDL